MGQLRSFFAQLHYPPQSGSSAPPQERTYIFSQEEIATEPLKWLKYLLMARVGLISAEELQTHNYPQRYSMGQLEVARQQCHAIARRASTSGKDFMIVLKAVPKDNVGLIHNFRVYSSAEIDSAFAQIAQLCCTTKHQLWFCLSIIDFTTLSLGGRLTLPRGNRGDEIELIWHTSPRRIEEFSGADFAFPFWRAHRDLGQFTFRTELLHIPHRYLVNRHSSKESYLQDAFFVTRRLWQHSTAIHRLCTILYTAGANEVALEFKFEAGLLSFIDWDTGQELFR